MRDHTALTYISFSQFYPLLFFCSSTSTQKIPCNYLLQFWTKMKTRKSFTLSSYLLSSSWPTERRCKYGRNSDTCWWPSNSLGIPSQCNFSKFDRQKNQGACLLYVLISVKAVIKCTVIIHTFHFTVLLFPMYLMLSILTRGTSLS